MKIQRQRCQKLDLNHSGNDRSFDRTERVFFSDLIKGKHEGCVGCRLVCELLLLLNDYYMRPDDAFKLVVHYIAYSFTVESLLILKDGTRQAIWICQFELCKTNGE